MLIDIFNAGNQLFSSGIDQILLLKNTCMCNRELSRVNDRDSFFVHRWLHYALNLTKTDCFTVILQEYTRTYSTRVRTTSILQCVCVARLSWN